MRLCTCFIYFQGGILTVADDLLKNDGQKFLEMMESLADKRIQREREVAEGMLDLDDEDEEEEEDEDEYDDEGAHVAAILRRQR